MKRKSFIIHTILLIIIPALLLAGCVSPMGMTASTTPLDGKEIEVIGRAGGCSNWAGAVFGLWSVNRADINRAIDNALKMETDVVLLRRDDGRELVMKKGAVLRADNAGISEGIAGGFDKMKNSGAVDFSAGGSLLLKEGKLFIAGAEGEKEVAPGGIVSLGRDVRLKYIAGTESGSAPVLQKVAGDMLVYVDGRPRRLAEDESLALNDGFTLKQVRGDALINVRWYERTYFFVLFSLHRVYVQGDVVRFIKKEPLAPKPEEGPAASGKGRGSMRR